MADANEAACLPALDSTHYRPHLLHSTERNWPETNCYVDLWIEVLHSLGLEPAAALGFTVAQDFEGDQFTFFKFPPEDLATLFDLHVQELAIYDCVEVHALEQLKRRRLVLVEVDGYHLPDTRGTSYHSNHVKTTIGINRLDLPGRRLEYFHNSGFFYLEGQDFDGVFRRSAPAAVREMAMFPYVEFVKCGHAAHRGQRLHQITVTLLREHLRKRPVSNPIRAYQKVFSAHLELLSQRPLEFFHLYSFNTLRQLGANFELLCSHLAWLQTQGEPALADAIAGATLIAGSAKSLQFQLARAVARKRFDKLEGTLDGMAEAYDQLFSALSARYPA